MFIFWPQGIKFMCPRETHTYNQNLGHEGSRVSDSYRWNDREDSDDDASDGSVEYPTEEAFDRAHTVVRDTFGYTRRNKKFLYYTWLHFATDYSRRVFGKENDTFPALWTSAILHQKHLHDTPT
jgi:hypothetical protein